MFRNRTKKLGSSFLQMVCSTLIVASIATSAFAADEYPTRPIRLIIPQAPGGGSDTLGRFIADKLSQSLGKQVIVENKPGAAGMIGAEQVRRSAPDGYTLLLCAIDTITAPLVSQRPPFDAIKDFAPVTQLAQSPNVWLVSPSFEAKTMRQLIDIAKAQPGKLDYASSGIGGMQHLGGEMLVRMAGIQLAHVPYKGGPPGLLDVAAGRVPVMVSGFQAAVSNIRSGKVRALAVTGKKRSTALSELPTVAEALGLPEYEAMNWQGLLFPAETPKPIVDRVASETIKILSMPDTRARLEALGYEPVGNTPTEFAALMSIEQKRWGAIIKAAGIIAE